jgi:hypothetical protein
MPSLSPEVGSFDCGMRIFQIIITGYLPCSLSRSTNNRIFRNFRAVFWRLSHRTTLNAVLACIVFIAAVLSLISLTPRFSEVHDRVYHHNRFSGLLAQTSLTLS